MANNTNGKIKVTLVKSTIGCLEKQKKTVQALGLHKIRSSAIHEDNAAIRGMISSSSTSLRSNPWRHNYENS